jgi:hypothetical protein
MAQPAKIGKRQDKLPLESLRALEDVHSSLKEFAKQDSVGENEALNTGVKTARHKAKKLRKFTAELATLWDRTFEAHDLLCAHPTNLHTQSLQAHGRRVARSSG